MRTTPLREHGSAAKIICVEGLGSFSIGENPRPLFLDTIAIAFNSESFEGPKFMSEEMIDFIRNWEVARYRSTEGGGVSSGSSSVPWSWGVWSLAWPCSVSVVSMTTRSSWRRRVGGSLPSREIVVKGPGEQSHCSE